MSPHPHQTSEVSKFFGNLGGLRHPSVLIFHRKRDGKPGSPGGVHLDPAPELMLGPAPRELHPQSRGLAPVIAVGHPHPVVEHGQKQGSVPPDHLDLNGRRKGGAIGVESRPGRGSIFRVYPPMKCRGNPPWLPGGELEPDGVLESRRVPGTEGRGGCEAAFLPGPGRDRRGVDQRLS